MATVKLVINTPAFGEIQAGFDLPDQDAGRILGWAEVAFGGVIIDPVTGEERDLNAAELLKAVAVDLLMQTVQKVETHERNQASKRAAAEVPTIMATPI